MQSAGRVGCRVRAHSLPLSVLRSRTGMAAWQAAPGGVALRNHDFRLDMSGKGKSREARNGIYFRCIGILLFSLADI